MAKDFYYCAPVNPRGVAAWLVAETCLTFYQIAEFCGLHYMEVHAIANDEVKVQPFSPVESGQLSRAEINRCQDDESAHLQLSEEFVEVLKNKSSQEKKSKYKPLAKRAILPSAILYVVQNYPFIQDIGVSKLLRATKATVAKIRNGLYSGLSDMAPVDPVISGFCSKKDLQDCIEKYSKNENEN